MKKLLLSLLIASGTLMAVAQDLPASKQSGSWPTAPGIPDNAVSERVVVDVWAPSTNTNEEPEPAVKLSRRFAGAALNTTATLQNTERRIEQSIRMGFPLGGNWIQVDFDSIDASLRMAELAVMNNADHQAWIQLQDERDRLKSWTDWLIDQNRHLRLANYYISPATLDNDERFQATVVCTKFLSSMLASQQLADDYSCRQ